MRCVGSWWAERSASCIDVSRKETYLWRCRCVARAGKWRFDNGEQVERIEDNSAAMVAATPTVIDIDYVLAERSREYFGEGVRWLDLVRTQKWGELAASYKIASNSASDHSPTTTTRSIESFHYLRPIPQNQIDALDMTEAEKEAYQNPGY